MERMDGAGRIVVIPRTLKGAGAIAVFVDVESEESVPPAVSGVGQPVNLRLHQDASVGDREKPDDAAKLRIFPVPEDLGECLRPVLLQNVDQRIVNDGMKHKANLFFVYQYVKKRESVSKRTDRTGSQKRYAGKKKRREEKKMKRKAIEKGRRTGALWLGAAALLLAATAAVGCIGDSAKNSKNPVEDDTQLAFAGEFAAAAANRDADAVYAMLAPELQERAEEFGIFTEDGRRTMGFSSPFISQEPEVSYLTGTSGQTEYNIEYRATALTSVPELYIWKGWLMLEQNEETYRVTKWKSALYTDVAGISDCMDAYGQGIWDFTTYDLGDGIVGERLQQHFEEGTDPDYYGGFIDPGYALEKCLHLTDGEVKEIAPQEDQGRIYVTYGWESGEAVFEMAREKEGGIWVPVKLVEIKDKRE